MSHPSQTSGGSDSDAMDVATLSAPDTTKLASSTASCVHQTMAPEGSYASPCLSLQAPSASATIHIHAPFKAGQADKHSDILADLSSGTGLQETVLAVSLAEGILIDTASLHHILPGLADWAAHFELI